MNTPSDRSDSTHKITTEEAGERLDRWLASDSRLGSRSKAARALERGRIFIDGKEQDPRQANRKLEAEQSVRIWLDRPGSAKRARFLPHVLGDLEVVYEDEDLVVVNKPSGLLTVPRSGDHKADTVLSRLERAIDTSRRRQLFVVHRIDQGTSGLVVVARQNEARDHLQAQFLARTPERQYLAVVQGRIEKDRGTWKDTLVDSAKTRIGRRAREGEPTTEAIAHFATVERFVRACLVAVDLVTGKRNQIRIHCSTRGHPIVGDALYQSESEENRIVFTRPALHSARLSFEHPRTGKRVEFSAPIAPDMKKLIRRLSQEKPERVETAEDPETPNAPVTPEKPARRGKTGKPGNSGKSGKPGKTGKPWKPGKRED